MFNLLNLLLFSTTCLFTPTTTATLHNRRHNDLNRRSASLPIPPVNFGIVLFRGFEAIDAFGPLEILNLGTLSHFRAKLYIIAETLNPVTTKPVMNVTGADFGESVVPTHTFAHPPEDLDVLLVPGGVGTRDLNKTQPIVDFVKEAYPKLRWLITGCTGVSLVARAGILDGRRATGNKKSWDFVTKQGPKVHWVPKARWVVDGNIWSASGLTAFLDTTFAWVSNVFGEDVASDLANGIEYPRILDSSWDPFAEMYNLTGWVNPNLGL